MARAEMCDVNLNKTHRFVSHRFEPHPQAIQGIYKIIRSTQKAIEVDARTQQTVIFATVDMVVQHHDIVPLIHYQMNVISICACFQCIAGIFN